MDGCWIFGGSPDTLESDLIASSGLEAIVFGSSGSLITTETEAWFSFPMAERAGWIVFMRSEILPFKLVSLPSIFLLKSEIYIWDRPSVNLADASAALAP